MCSSSIFVPLRLPLLLDQRKGTGSTPQASYMLSQTFRSSSGASAWGRETAPWEFQQEEVNTHHSSGKTKNRKPTRAAQPPTSRHILAPSVYSWAHCSVLPLQVETDSNHIKGEKRGLVLERQPQPWLYVRITWEGFKTSIPRSHEPVKEYFLPGWGCGNQSLLKNITRGF